MENPSLKHIKDNIIPICQTDSKLLFILRKFVHAETGHEIWIAGTRHTNNPESIQMKKLISASDEWIRTSKSPIAVCVERSCRIDGVTNLNDAMKKCGESAVIRLMCQNHKLEEIVIEPDFNKQVIPWSKELVGNGMALASWALLNFIYTINGKVADASPALKQNFRQVIQTIGMQFGMSKNYSKVLNNINLYLKENNEGLIVPDILANEKVRLDMSLIEKSQSVDINIFETNRAGIAFNQARDYGMLINILKASDNNKNIFVWMGLNHVLSLSPALESLGYKKTSPESRQ